MTKDEALAKAKETSNNLDAVADKSREGAHRLVDRVYDSKVTWVVLVAILASICYIAYRILG